MVGGGIFAVYVKFFILILFVIIGLSIIVLAYLIEWIDKKDGRKTMAEKIG